MASEEQNSESYSANPNQKVYDTPHVVDHLVDVIAIYFAEKKKKFKWVPKDETYTVNKGGKIADIKKIFTDKFKKEKKTVQNLKTDPDHTAALKPKDEVKVTWDEQEEDGFEYVKIPKAKYGKPVFIVAKCNGDNGKLTVEINENKLSNPEAVYENPVKFLIGETESAKVEFTLSKDKNEYLQEIILKPKSEESHKKLVENFGKRTDKNAFLYLKGEVSGTQDEIKFPDETKEFLNKDNDRFEVFYCDCGEKYKNDIECTRYGKKNPIYGPVYWGKLALKDFTKWDDLTKNSTVTADEKAILIAMSENEGNLDAVQSYDSEILTAGAMQKTINPSGFGELPIQFWEFKSEFPLKYASYLENCGWEVVAVTNEGKGDTYQAQYKGLTGSELKTKIREGFDKSNLKDKVPCEPIEPIINLMNDVDFQTKQIKDFVKRLKNAINKTPSGYSNKISAYVSSNLGKATVLDNDVNRPGQVKDCFGAALDSFYAKNPKVSKNPADWAENRATYETEILEIYGPLRGEGDYTMTNATDRYNDLKTKL